MSSAAAVSLHHMQNVTFDISVSLDGFSAGPDPTPDEPLGAGGMQLHEWAVRVHSWREQHGHEGGEKGGVDDDMIKEHLAGKGAVIMGRKMFSGQEGPWGDEPFEGWWGDEPPFRVPVFVLTHHEREPLVKGETTFTFVTDGIESALEQARAAAGDAGIHIAGGAETVQQYLAAGHVDGFQLHVAPVILGAGTRLFDGIAPQAYELDRVLASDLVTHMRFTVPSSGPGSPA